MLVSLGEFGQKVNFIRVLSSENRTSRIPSGNSGSALSRIFFSNEKTVQNPLRELLRRETLNQEKKVEFLKQQPFAQKKKGEEKNGETMLNRLRESLKERTLNQRKKQGKKIAKSIPRSS